MIKIILQRNHRYLFDESYMFYDGSMYRWYGIHSVFKPCLEQRGTAYGNANTLLMKFSRDATTVFIWFQRCLFGNLTAFRWFNSCNDIMDSTFFGHHKNGMIFDLIEKCRGISVNILCILRGRISNIEYSFRLFLESRKTSTRFLKF